MSRKCFFVLTAVWFGLSTGAWGQPGAQDRSSGQTAAGAQGAYTIKDGWAWVQANPQSPDGKNHFEPAWSLLRKQGGQWKVLYMRPCCGECADDPDCADDKRLYRMLKRTWPEAPEEIFPSRPGPVVRRHSEAERGSVMLRIYAASRAGGYGSISFSSTIRDAPACSSTVRAPSSHASSRGSARHSNPGGKAMT